MADSESTNTSPSTPNVQDGLKDLHLQKEGTGNWRGITVSKKLTQEYTLGSDMSSSAMSRGQSLQSPRKHGGSPQSSTVSTPRSEDIIPGSVSLKQQPGQHPKLARSTSQKVTPRAPPTYHDYPNKTEEAKGTFHAISGCIYSSKAIGATDHAMDCECAEEWDPSTQVNAACGEDSDCINRATKMECVGDCGCGADCQNQRFQRQQFAKVTVIKTEKKGYGLRADTDLRENDFVFEYIGEVIGEGQFRRRMQQYDEEKIKHFYFMSLNKGEFVDATKKGNLGRFCNHSCNPNCYVDKWVVGDKLRMGIFAERSIQAGEELVFNYNVDRYGADPQPCYCGEPNCTGFIGGKTQTESGTKLPQATVEALGIDDGDSWDTAVAKKPRKKKVNEEDEEWVNKVEPKGLDEDGVTKVMATLMQCKEKWITVKLLSRIQRSNDERVRNRVVKMHGYQILNTVLALFKDDFNIVLQILDILDQFPRLTRNKISDSKIEGTVETLKDCGDERVEAQATALLKEWSTLETAYRIPRKKRDPNVSTPTPKNDHSGRRDVGRSERKARSRSRSRSKSRSRSRSLDAPRGPSAVPGGPRAMPIQRPMPFYSGPRPTYRPPRQYENRLPEGWYPATTEDGRTYYYNARGATTWTRPTFPAIPPPPPQKAASNNKALEDIISEITSAKAHALREKSSATVTPQPTVSEPRTDLKASKDKWRAYPEEKQKKVYENTLFPHIKSVMDKYKHKLPKDDLKRFAKQIGKKLVESDYKRNRVEDPTKISPQQEKHVKKHVKEFFDKAVTRKKERDGKEAGTQKKNEMPAASDTPEAAAYEKPDEGSDDEEKMGLSEDEAEAPAPELGTPANSVTPLTSACQLVNGNRPKRRRSEDGESDGVGLDEVGSTPRKRLRSETPPPPPPPPEENFLDMTPPSSAHNLIKGADFKAMTQNGHMMDEDICKNPPRPAPVGSVYTDHEETVDLNGGGASPMFLNGVGNSPSDGDEGGMDKSNLAIHGMGIGQMPEVEVHQGH
ncbi:MAG: hypothetical protein LQ346_000209 [Caloplaca aetnensis]|nr:MAG: hypothetical protein LQ346_000209 [Caloplaca aetnensis]